MRYAYIIKCDEVIKDPTTGEIKELRCSYDPATRGGNTPDGRKIKGTIHWVSATDSIRAEVRVYDRLFNVAHPEADKDVDFKTHLNPDSLTVLKNCFVETSLANTEPEEKFQFERLGYFCVDQDSTADKLVFNRTVTLKDSWAKRSS